MTDTPAHQHRSPRTTPAIDDQAHPDICGRVHCLWTTSIERAELLAALRVAIEQTTTGGQCQDSQCHHHGDHPTAQHLAAWQQLTATITRIPAIHIRQPLIIFDADACRAWLENGAGAKAAIGEDFNSDDGTIAAGLEELLSLLSHDRQQSAWHTHEPLDHVSIWRTADNDGVDGGGILTADLKYGNVTVRIASLHQGADEFTDDPQTCGVEAAIQALRHTTEVINREYTNLTQLLPPTPTPPSTSDDDEVYTVIGVWIGDRPVPVGVIEGQHAVHGGYEDEFPEGLWATSVSTGNPDEAEHAAIAEMLDSLG